MERKTSQKLIHIGNIHNFPTEKSIDTLPYIVAKVKGIWIEEANNWELRCYSLCKGHQ